MMAKENLDNSEEGVFSDEIFIQAILFKIKTSFKNFEDEEDFIREIKELKMKKENNEKELIKTEDVIKKKKAGKTDNKKNQQQNLKGDVEDPKKTLMDLKKYYYTKGWVIIDFPKNLEQVLKKKIFLKIKKIIGKKIGKRIDRICIY